ncbi:uncharacterized protein LOC128268033 [Anopheles cruzii]|uniref:uncharacterized protein LOC128268033 n=1 Tax=Anopheles cruzii TaxID=68878 RepID=UPI0022EC5F04|nr:uncharacterized protein LOC128268033 [Anopheles cruzii]
MLQQVLCTLGPFFLGMPKDPRTVFQEAGEIKPTDVLHVSGEVVGSFWHRGLEAGIRAQSPLTIGIEALQYYLHVAKVPLPQLAHPGLQTWVIQGQLLEATGEPGEPFVVSVYCGSVKPTAPVLLGPVCNEANQLRQHARDSQTADIRTRAVLADAEARALVKGRIPILVDIVLSDINTTKPTANPHPRDVRLLWSCWT